MCKFCESLEIWQNTHKFTNDRIQNKTKQEYTVALLIHTWCPKYKTKRQASRTTDYRNKGLGYKLNYCPERGRKLKV